MKLERTKNSVRNIFWGVSNKLVCILFPFLVRTILIYYLGVDYLGINSLFTSILTVLNLAELGFSSAVVYNMYKPIADNDEKTICALLKYYKKVYTIIGIIVGICGIAVIPFLPKLIEGDYPNDVNLNLLYCFFLFNTCVSYFLFAYKNCILEAYQRVDIISKINIVLKSIMYILQAAVLVAFHNYYLYLLVMILNTIVTNIVTAYFSNKYYPQYVCEGELGLQNIRQIRKNIQGLFIGKVCLVSRNSLDSIFLSKFLGLSIVAMYGNYYYIMNSIIVVLNAILASLSAGIGNSVATETVEKNYRDYNKFLFIYAWIVGWCTICLLILYQPFMRIWMGESMLFPYYDVILICIYFYTLTIGSVRSQYSSATGLFWENRIYVLVETITNVILNYFLGKLFGVTGIIFATIVSIVLINFIWGTAILFKFYFKEYSLIRFMGKHLKYALGTLVTAGGVYIVSTFIKINNVYINFFTLVILCLIMPNVLFWFLFFRCDEYKSSRDFILTIIDQVKNKYLRN